MNISSECIHPVADETTKKMALHADDIFIQADDFQCQMNQAQHINFDTQNSGFPILQNAYDAQSNADRVHVSADDNLQSPQCNMFLAGYMDCAEEALWYLTEVEKLPPDHPMVMGLKMNLYEQYRILHLQSILRNSLFTCNESNFSPEVHSSQSTYSVKELNVIENDANKGVNNCAIQIESNALRITEKSTVESSESVQCVVEPVKDSHRLGNNLSESNKDNDVETSQLPTAEETGLSPEAHKMAVTLAEEIYALLNGQDGSDFSDDEDDSIDEGFEEMIEL